MAFKGQPVPTRTYQQARAKVSDGKSVLVVVPPNSGPVLAGHLYEFEGFLGFAVRGEDPIQWVEPGHVLDNSDEPQELILNIEQAEYETNQIAADGDFERGTLVYWDSAAKVLTEDPEGNRPAGRVTAPRDANDVIWFILGPQVFGGGGEGTAGTGDGGEG